MSPIRSRSYTHVRVNLETVGSANAYESLASSSPPSITTVGEPVPVHLTASNQLDRVVKIDGDRGPLRAAALRARAMSPSDAARVTAPALAAAP